MNYREKTSLFIIKYARKFFRNTWVHKLSVTSKIYRWLFSLNFKASEMEIDFRSYRFAILTKDTTIVPSLINQDYEAFELDVFERLLKPGMIVLDIGANIGVYSVIASKKIGKPGQVYAFEPVPENYKMLKRNISLNRATNVEPISTAISDRLGQTDIYVSPDNIGTHSLGRPVGKPLAVRLDTIDNFVSRRKIKPDIIKIDVEGFEGQAFRGGQNTLKQENIIVLTEFSSMMLKECGSNPEIVAKYIYDNFLYSYAINERQCRLYRIRKLKDLLALNNDNLLLSHLPVDISFKSG